MKPGLEAAMKLWQLYQMELQADLYEKGSIFSVNDPELRELELAAAASLRQRIAEGEWNQ